MVIMFAGSASIGFAQPVPVENISQSNTAPVISPSPAIQRSGGAGARCLRPQDCQQGLACLGGFIKRGTCVKGK